MKVRRPHTGVKHRQHHGLRKARTHERKAYMKWLIAADSSCDLYTMETGARDIAYHTVPFTVTLDHAEYRDTDDLNISEMVDAMERSTVCRTACPSVGAWCELFERAEQTIALTISSRLSGSYNSAMAARKLVLEEHPEKRIAVVDSLSTGPKLVFLAQRALEMMQANEAFDGIITACQEMSHSVRTLFTLSSFHNLVANGRMNRVAGFIAGKLGIRIIGEGSAEGTIRLKDKGRGDLKTLRRIVELMAQQNFMGGRVVISHCLNAQLAKKLRELIVQRWQNCDIQILPTRGLDSFYAERNGLIMCY